MNTGGGLAIVREMIAGCRKRTGRAPTRVWLDRSTFMLLPQQLRNAGGHREVLIDGVSVRWHEVIAESDYHPELHYQRRRWQAAPDVVIIDEASMVPIHSWNGLSTWPSP